MRIEEVQSTTKKQRIATHTHIKGLGIAVRAVRPIASPYLTSRAAVYMCRAAARGGRRPRQQAYA
jgi:DNA helicase TIP49 (TBP-interacting protein)